MFGRPVGGQALQYGKMGTALHSLRVATVQRMVQLYLSPGSPSCLAVPSTLSGRAGRNVRMECC
jgi:hypothetical protein